MKLQESKMIGNPIRLLCLLLFFMIAPLFGNAKKVVVGGSIQSPQTLDPAQAWDEVSVSLASNLFETLVKLNPETSEIEPCLAISWETRNRGKLWIFKLKEMVRFHDGSNFDAHAVVFSFQRQMDKKFKYRFYDFPLFDDIFKNLVSVSALNANMVVFNLRDPFYPFLAAMTSSCASIVSPTALKKYREKFFQNPIGTGPFMLKIWKKGERIVLVANPDYWGKKPKFDEYINIIENKHDKLHKLFRDQTYDFIDSISISQTVGLRNLSWATVKVFPKFAITFIAFNFKNIYLQKENVRKALRLLWDARFLKYVFQDYMISLKSILPEGMPGYGKMLEIKKFSIKEAARLLKEESVGEKIVFTFLITKESSLDRQMISMFSKNLNRVGIELRIESVTQDEYTRRIGNGDFDLTISGWVSDYPDPHSILSSLFNTQLQKNGFANISSYKDDWIRFRINRSSIESDSRKRKDIIEEIVRIIDNKVLCIPVYQGTAVIVYNNKKINKIIITPVGNLSLSDIKKK